MHNLEDIFEKVILIGVETPETGDVEASLDELSELAKTAGATTVGRLIQSRECPHPATYIGQGKLEEVADMIERTGATGIICDDELSPSQMRNLEKELDIKVMDRTVLILDIFAGRATTAEGKIQVELAQLKYSLTRLQGFGTSMSRLGGGIGTRGPGESKLESDRRVVRNRVSKLNADLKEVVKQREVKRVKRQKNYVPVVAIVGYTNAGKSTLLNKLTDSSVLSEDKLFATLDPTTREYRLESGESVLFTDTVGFINKLPHHLVEAFKSTLEEAKYADIILHVVDASNPNYQEQMEVVYETLANLKVEGKPIITAFNKSDALGFDVNCRDFRATDTLCISAKNGNGLDSLNKAIWKILRAGKVHIEKTFSFSEGNKLQWIRTKGELIKEEYVPEGIYVEAYVPKELAGKL